MKKQNYKTICLKMVIKNHAEGAEEGVGYRILDDDAFWNQSKFSNIWAIQYETNPSTDEVEHRDTTPHCTYADANLGDFQSQFIDKWDAAVIAIAGAISLQLLKTLNPVLFWIIFGILLWIAIYKLIRRYG